ncbi:MAG: hypothetical protein MZW92_38155 [Comamonadaceae bacterium]|nr:hypothetical protein [Comamonadaceae bacterium]
MLVRFFQSRERRGWRSWSATRVQAGTDVCFRLDRDAAVCLDRGVTGRSFELEGVFECDMAARDRPRPLRPATGAATMERLRRELPCAPGVAHERRHTQRPAGGQRPAVDVRAAPASLRTLRHGLFHRRTAADRAPGRRPSPAS